jgi:predicted YcjX-like family ATPase
MRIPFPITLPTSLTELAKGSTVNIAVTGLSRAGKTAFITSLIHNLLSAVYDPELMPLLGVAGERRLVSAKLAGAKAGRLPRFPYRRNIEKVTANPPVWPAGTTDISEIEIDIRFLPAGTLGKLLGRVSSEAATLRIRIVDYPGEWLLDLPLLAQDYAQWSRATLKLLRRGVRAEPARPYLDFLARHPYEQNANEETAREAHDLYRAFLLEARDRHALSYLQPGRFLCPGSAGEAPYFWFAPLDIPEGIEEAPAGSLAGLMQERFEVYKKEVVFKFYDDHFRHYSRQVVLVDLLSALLAGHDAFDDTRRALDAVVESFRYGRGGILSRLLHGVRIEKVLFAATKADHIPQIQWDHLAELLRHTVAGASLEIKSSSAAMDVGVLASVVSTTESTQEIGGQQVQVVVGKPLGQDKQRAFFAGNVPIRPPRPEAWRQPFLNVPTFEPPPIEASPVTGIPHINLDATLEYLVGDRLR